MKASARPVRIGVTAGIVSFGVALGAYLLITWALRSDAAMRPAPISEAVVAPAQKLGDAFAMIAAHVKPAVVSVFTERTITIQGEQSPFGSDNDFFRQFFGGQVPSVPHQLKGVEHGMGSGMILDKQGHILTNYHVVKGEQQLQVQLADKRKLDAIVVGTDPRTDVAIIKIKGDVPGDLPTVQLGDSDALKPGNLVIAIGAPFGFQQTVTQGIISATGRSDIGIADIEDFLQTDAAIDPGNSGGPLVNMRGEVIGMNSAIATKIGQFAGVGFAIPANMIKSMMPKLLKGEKIQRGMLGVVIQNLTTGLAKTFGLPNTKGALVSQVNKGSSAGKAGMKPGDVIVGFDGKEVTDSTGLRNLVAATSPGSKATVEIMRDGKTQTLDVIVGTLGETTLPAAPATEPANPLASLGLTVHNLTPNLASQLALPEGETGVVIIAVQEGSPASLANLQVGDLIVQANHEPVASVDQLDSAVARDKQSLLLLIKRKGESLFVVLSRE